MKTDGIKYLIEHALCGTGDEAAAELEAIASEIERKDEALREILSKCQCTELCNCSSSMSRCAGIALSEPTQNAKNESGRSESGNSPRVATSPHVVLGPKQERLMTAPEAGSNPAVLTICAMPLDLDAKPEGAHPACVAATLREIAKLESGFMEINVGRRAAEIEKAGKL